MIELNKGEYKSQCPECAKNGRDNSQDNLHNYGDGLGSHCFSCGFTIPSEEFLNGETIKKGDKILITQKDTESLQNKALTPEQLQKVHDKTVPRINVKYRGLDNEVCEKLGVRWELDENGKPCAMYFPTTIQKDGEDVVTGYKVRKFPKDFYSVGYVGKMNGVIGQNKAIAETLILTAGELDLITAIGALENGDKYRKSYNVVTSPLGEDSTAQMIKLNYDWVDSHKKIIVCMDNDAAGEQAFEKIRQVVDNDKLFKSNLRHKDLNDYLKAGDADKIPSDLYWNATPVKSFGIMGSGDIFDKILETVSVERIPLPPFLSGLDETFSGGIPLGEVVNIVSSVSTGKTVFINEIIMHWIMHSPHRTLIISLEDNVGSYGAKLASRITGVNILALRTIEEKKEVLLNAQERVNNYLVDEDGSHRFEIMEKIPSTLDGLKKAIIQSIKVYGTKVILIDPLQSVIGTRSNEEQVDWMLFEEEIRRDYNVTIVNIAHTRKSGSGEKAHSEGGNFSEESIKGSSQISATATINILLSRDKMAEDPIERNTTYVSVSKNRTSGITGRDITKVYYSGQHHTLFNFEYAQKNNFFKGLTNEEFRNKLDKNHSTEVTPSVVEDVVGDDLDDSLGVF